MHFERTRHFFEAVNDHRTGLRGLHGKYDADLKNLEQYKGSKGYDKEVAEIEKKRKEALVDFRNRQAKRFNEILDGMRESATSRPMIAPTPEELALLQTLKMRDKIGRDELEQAARTLKNSPVGLSVLNEIAEKNEIRGVHFGEESTASVMAHIDALAESAKRLIALERCDSKQEMIARANIHNPEHTNDALYSFTADRDYISEEDALAYMGGVDNLESFRDAVNN